MYICISSPVSMCDLCEDFFLKPLSGRSTAISYKKKGVLQSYIGAIT